MGIVIMIKNILEMNVPNKLTLLRILLIPFFLLAMLYEKLDSIPSHILIAHIIALFIYAAASLTDYFDGYLARKYKVITNFGKLVDPLADKLLVMTAFVALVEMQIFPAWIVILILCREFIVTGLRGIAAAQGRVIQADRWGKHKMVSQTITIIAALLSIVVRDALIVSGRWTLSSDKTYWGEGEIIGTILLILILICAFFTLASGWNYILRNRDIIRE